LGLKYDYFYSLTPRVFDNISKGKIQEKERDFKENWERVRAVIVASLTPHIQKGSSRKAQKVYPLPWDNEKIDHVDDVSDKKRARDLWDNIDKNKIS
jgi:hypothetical protein